MHHSGVPLLAVDFIEKKKKKNLNQKIVVITKFTFTKNIVISKKKKKKKKKKKINKKILPEPFGSKPNSTSDLGIRDQG